MVVRFSMTSVDEKWGKIVTDALKDYFDKKDENEEYETTQLTNTD